MKQNESVTHLMSTSPITATTVTSLKEVATLFAEHQIHHIPVTEGKKLVGIISYSDLMRMSFADALNQDRKEVLAYLDETKTIKDVMSTQVTKLTTKNSIKEAAKALCQGDFHALCIENEDQELAGIVTSTDVIKYLVDLY